MNGTLNVRDRDVLAVSRDELGCGILLEVVSAEVGNVVLVERADGTGRVSIGESLVGDVDGVIDLVGVGLEVIDVKEGSNGPVAVECKIGNGEVDLGSCGRAESYEAFNVHTVLEAAQVFLVRIGNSDGDGNVSGRACGNGKVVAVQSAARNACDLDGGAVIEEVALLVYGVFAVACLGIADTLGHNDCRYIIGK